MSRPTAAGVSVCSALLAVYAATAWAAARRHSPTFDEPYHATAAWVQSHRHDYRIDNEDPPLWMAYASLPNGPRALSADFDGPTWRDMATNVSTQWEWVVQTLYRTPGNDGAAVVRRCQAMMLAVAVVLGGTIAAWAWRLGGPTAAVVATAAFALDPNFLGHGPLMKNDVAAAAAWLWLAWGTWAVGRRVTPASVAAVAGLAAVPITIKFNGLLAAAVVPAALVCRALLPEAWPVGRRLVGTRRGRLGVAAVIAAVCAATAVGGVWAMYGFRFRSGPVPGDHLDMPLMADQAVQNERVAHPDRDPPGLPVRAAMFADRHRLLPEPFLAGFLFTYGQSLVRPAYLLGEISLTGWRSYFPFAMLVKTPVATLAAVAAVTLAAIANRRHTGPARWAAIALVAPVAVYMASAVSSNLNIGLRHVLPVYPPLFVAVGWSAAVALRRPRPQGARAAIAVLAIGLAVETAASYPHFVAFFNAPAAAWGDGGFDLLADSNLDWGQDLPALVGWQRSHPDDPLYLSYFGLADPRSYGLRYTPLPGGYDYDRPPLAFPSRGRACWLAVSAQNLQEWQIGRNVPLRGWYQRLAARRPDAVAGRSIFLYRYDPIDAFGAASGRAARDHF